MLRASTLQKSGASPMPAGPAVMKRCPAVGEVKSGGREVRSGEENRDRVWGTFAMLLPLTPLRFLERAENLFGDKQGVVCGERRFSYREFGQRCRKLAGALSGLGVKAGERVAVLGLNCHRLLEAYFGVPMAGAVLLPLNIRLSAGDLAAIWKDAGTRVLLVDPEFLPLAEKMRECGAAAERTVLLDEGRPKPEWVERQTYDELLQRAGEADDAAAPDWTRVEEDTVAELFYTSGTTGDAKGVMLSHRTLYLHALNTMIAKQFTDRMVMLHAVPLYHANGWGNAHMLTAAGATHVVLRRFDPAQVCRLVERERVTALCLVPTMATMLLNYEGLGGHDLSSLEWMEVGGAAASERMVERLEEEFGCLCYSGYGLTESGPVLSISRSPANAEQEARLEQAGGPAADEEKLWRKASAGRAIVGAELRVVDERGEDVPRDSVTMGEIIARGDGVMDGYWGRVEETREVLAGGWLRTGDMAVWDEQGWVQIVDRRKEIIISGGENISSLEIERALASHPAVMECAVIPVPDEKWGETPKALVVLRAGARASEEELIGFLRERMAGFKVPRSVEFVASLPKGGTGKIMKKALREKYWAGKVKRVN